MANFDMQFYVEENDTHEGYALTNVQQNIFFFKIINIRVIALMRLNVACTVSGNGDRLGS